MNNQKLIDFLINCTHKDKVELLNLILSTTTVTLFLNNTETRIIECIENGLTISVWLEE